MTAGRVFLGLVLEYRKGLRFDTWRGEIAARTPQANLP
jgi:hypothetical protein